jgi:hypothetical protein
VVAARPGVFVHFSHVINTTVPAATPGRRPFSAGAPGIAHGPRHPEHAHTAPVPERPEHVRSFRADRPEHVHTAPVAERGVERMAAGLDAHGHARVPCSRWRAWRGFRAFRTGSGRKRRTRLVEAHSRACWMTARRPAALQGLPAIPPESAGARPACGRAEKLLSPREARARYRHGSFRARDRDFRTDRVPFRDRIPNRGRP